MKLLVKLGFECTSCIDTGLEAEIKRESLTADMSNDRTKKGSVSEAKTPQQAFHYANRREVGLLKTNHKSEREAKRDQPITRR